MELEAETGVVPPQPRHAGSQQKLEEEGRGLPYGPWRSTALPTP